MVFRLLLAQTQRNALAYLRGFGKKRLDQFEKRTWELRPKWEDDIEELDEEDFAATLGELLEDAYLSDLEGDIEI